MNRKERKDLGKREGFWNRVWNWTSGQKPPTTEQGYTQGGHNPGQWPEQFNDTPLTGDRYVNGVCCRTVGEYKAAQEKADYDMGGLGQ